MLYSKAEQTALQYNMFEKSREITVALSGGADSMALLHVLLALKDKYVFAVSAAHLNHMLRGEESERDELFVRKVCKELSVPLTVERADISALSLESGDSIELCARKVRYEFLERVSAGLIATAHTLSDSAETVLFNIARGTGLKGLAGIPPVRGRIIRPLINCTRNDVIEYLNTCDALYVTDSTNDQDDYTRNKIRHHVVPILEEINPAFVSAIGRLSALAAEDDLYLDSISKDLLTAIKCGDNKLDGSVLKNQPVSIRLRVVNLFYKEMYGEALDYHHLKEIDHILESGTGRTSLPKGSYATLTNKVFHFAPLAAKEKSAKNNAVIFDLSFPTQVFGGIRANMISKEEYDEKYKVNNLLFKYAIDYDKIVGKITIRNRLAGDSLREAGRGVSKSLKKLFNEAGIPVRQREKLVVLADDEGVVWVELFGVCERCAVCDKTENILFMQKL